MEIFTWLWLASLFFFSLGFIIPDDNTEGLAPTMFVLGTAVAIVLLLYVANENVTTIKEIKIAEGLCETNNGIRQIRYDTVTCTNGASFTLSNYTINPEKE